MVLLFGHVGLWINDAHGPLLNMRLTPADAMLLGSQLLSVAEEAEKQIEARQARELLTDDRHRAESDAGLVGLDEEVPF